MNIDLLTLPFVVSLANLLQVIALFIQYCLDKEHNGLGWLTLGTAFWAMGFIFIDLQITSNLAPFAIILNNALFISGLALQYIGIRRFQGWCETHFLLAAFCALGTLICIYFTLFNNNFIARQINISLVLTVLTFLIACRILESRKTFIPFFAYFLFGLFSANGLFLTLRALSAINSAWFGADLTRFLADTGSYIMALVMTTLWTYCFIIMINQRLIKDNRKTKENLELIFNTNPDGFVITRLSDGCLIEINNGFTALTGFTRQEVIGKSTLDVKLWKNPADRINFTEMLYKNGFCENLEVLFQRKDGSPFIANLSSKIIDLDGIPHTVGSIRDITASKKAREEKQKAEAWLRTLSVAIEQTPVTTVITDLNGNMVFVNPKFTETTGYTAEEALGKNPRILQSGSGTVSDYQKLWQTILSGQNWHGTFHNKKKNGDLYWESAVISPVKDENGVITHFLAVKEDITERKHLQEELERQATTDGLTGITNRRHFIELAQNELHRAVRLNHPLSIAIIDIDHFKSINDTLGHAWGDQALIIFTQTCLNNIRQIDIFARLGGDEFVLLLPETDPDHTCLAIERIRLALSAIPIDISNSPLFITISAGISSLVGSQETLDTLIGRADQALYQAKKQGRNRTFIKHLEN